MTDAGGRAGWGQILKSFVVDLGVGDDRVPLERVLRRHRAAFDAVLATGRTWPQIARVLTEAGARHKNGQPMSAKQLRTVYARTGKALAGHVSRAAGNADSDIEQPARATPAKLRDTPPTIKPSLKAADATGERVMMRLAEARRTRAALTRDFDE